MKNTELPITYKVGFSRPNEAEYTLRNNNGGFIGSTAFELDAAFIVKACNNHEKLIKANKILLMALKFALDNGGFYPDGADFLSRAYDEAIKAAQDD